MRWDQEKVAELMRKPEAKVEKKVKQKVIIDVAENLYTRLDDDTRRKQ